MLGEEVGDTLLGLKGKTHKKQRVQRKVKVHLKGKTWSKEQRRREVRNKRTKMNFSERKKELLATFGKAVEKIDEVCCVYVCAMRCVVCCVFVCVHACVCKESMPPAICQRCQFAHCPSCGLCCVVLLIYTRVSSVHTAPLVVDHDACR